MTDDEIMRIRKDWLDSKMPPTSIAMARRDIAELLSVIDEKVPKLEAAKEIYSEGLTVGMRLMRGEPTVAKITTDLPSACAIVEDALRELGGGVCMFTVGDSGSVCVYGGVDGPCVENAPDLLSAILWAQAAKGQRGT